LIFVEFFVFYFHPTRTRTAHSRTHRHIYDAF